MIAGIGWIGSALCVSSLIQNNQMRLRALNLGACAAMIAFNGANGTWSMVLLNVIVSIIDIRQIVALRSTVPNAIPVVTPEAASAPVDLVVDHQDRQLVPA